MNENIKVNDGGGLFDNEGLCDQLKRDLNNVIKCAMAGEYVTACALVAGMNVKLSNLKKGIKADTDSLKEKIEDLKRLINSMNEKDGVNDGAD